MKEAVVYNQKGEKVGKIELPVGIFDIKMNNDLVHQVIVSQMANRRQVSAHTKDRGAVSGGGKKPWRQKGTGRARHGSNRSPIWKGGGVTFGPTKDRNFKEKIPAKMRRKALFAVLSSKADNNEMIILDSLEISKPKTKLAKEILKNMPVEKKSCLFAFEEKNENFFKAIRNIPKIQGLEARNLNVLDILSSKYFLLSKEAINTIEKTFK